MNFKKLAVIFSVIFLSFGFVPASHAQVTSNSATVALSYTQSEALTVSATPGSISFTQVDNQNASASGPISVTTSWNFASNHSVTTAAYFASTKALSGPGAVNSIMVGNLYAKINAGAPAACNTTQAAVVAATAGASCPVVFTNASATGNSNHTDSVLLSISAPSAITPDSYTGTLTISAQAN
jgi:hypothetical protein